MTLNCIIIDDDEPCRKIAQELIQKTDGLNLVHTFSSAIEALNFLDSCSEPIDIIFLDIEMPGINGIEFIQTLHKKNPAIVLTTSHNEFALEAFENHVLDYLVKPLTYPRFLKAVLRAKETLNKHPLKNEDILFIKSETERIKIHGPDIIYLKAQGDYVTIYTQTAEYTIYSTLNAMEEKLFYQTYARVHRSFIVRIDKIEFLDDKAIALKDTTNGSLKGITIPIGPKYKDAFFKKINMI